MQVAATTHCNPGGHGLHTPLTPLRVPPIVVPRTEEGDP